MTSMFVHTSHASAKVLAQEYERVLLSHSWVFDIVRVLNLSEHTVLV